MSLTQRANHNVSTNKGLSDLQNTTIFQEPNVHFGRIWLIGVFIIVFGEHVHLFNVKKYPAQDSYVLPNAKSTWSQSSVHVNGAFWLKTQIHWF